MKKKIIQIIIGVDIDRWRRVFISSGDSGMELKLVFGGGGGGLIWKYTYFFGGIK